MSVSLNMPEGEERREVIERARYLERKHDLREPLAYTAAIAQLGAAVPRRIGAAESTVGEYLDELEERFGTQAIMPKQKQHRTGPLTEGHKSILVGPDDPPPSARDDPPELTDGDPRTIPEPLLEREQWLIRDGKIPKAPWAAGRTVDRGGGGGDDPGNDLLWTGFETADRYLDMLPTPKWGLYFVLRRAGPFVAIDLDGCRDPETGEIDDRARDIVDRADAFTEVSPSGTGLHIYVRGTLPAGRTNDTEGVELYDDRQLTVTGNHLADTPVEVPEQQDLIDSLAHEHMTETESASEASGERGGRGGAAVEPWSPFDALLVADVYPDLPTGTNVPHPEHESRTGRNFRIHPDGETATCWHAQHRVGDGDGCGLNAHHLLAMRATGADECDDIRRRWREDDRLVFETWRHTVKNEDHIELNPSPPPWRALRHVADEHDIAGLEDGGESARTAFRVVHRIIRVRHDIPVTFDGSEPGSDGANPGFDAGESGSRGGSGDEPPAE